MGTSENFSTNNTYVKYTISVTTNSQSIENNRTNVTVKVRFFRTNSGYSTYGSGTVYCKIDGTTYSASVSSSQKITNSGIDLFSKTLNIYHNSDGSKYLDTSAWISLNTPLTSSENYYGEWLSTIPRASVPTLSASSVNMGNSLTIYTNRVSGNFKHCLYYDINSGWKFIAENIDESYTWTVPEDFANNIPNSRSMKVKLWLETYNGGSYIGYNGDTFTARVPASIRPTINSVALTEAVPGLNEQFGTYVEGKSKISVNISASGAYSSTIKSYSATINDASYTTRNFTTDFLRRRGSNSCTIEVTDTRNRSESTSLNFDVTPYFSPGVNSFSVSRCKADGTPSDEGDCAKCTVVATIASVNNKNTKNFKIQYKKISESDWNTVVLDNSNYSINTTQVIENIDTESEYNFVMVVEDYFSAVQYSHNLSTAYTLMDFNKSGHGIAIGRVSTEDSFQVNMDIVQPSYFNGRRLQYVPSTVNGNGGGWYEVLHCTNAYQYEDYAIMMSVIQVHAGYGNQCSGIISLNVRISDYNMFAADWRIISGNLKASDFRLVVNGYTDFYVYAYVGNGWDKYLFEVLSEGMENHSSIKPIFEFTDTTTPYNGDPGGKIPECILYKPVTLYENGNGTSGTVTLSDYAYYYRIMDVCYRTNDWLVDTTRVLEPDGKNIIMQGAYYTESMAYSKLARARINNNTITFSFNGECNLTEDTITTGDTIYIIHVIGYT